MPDAVCAAFEAEPVTVDYSCPMHCAGIQARCGPTPVAGTGFGEQDESVRGAHSG